MNVHLRKKRFNYECIPVNCRPERIGKYCNPCRLHIWAGELGKTTFFTMADLARIISEKERCFCCVEVKLCELST
jgi:hypothetical protein